MLFLSQFFHLPSHSKFFQVRDWLGCISIGSRTSTSSKDGACPYHCWGTWLLISFLWPLFEKLYVVFDYYLIAHIHIISSCFKRFKSSIYLSTSVSFILVMHAQACFVPCTYAMVDVARFTLFLTFSVHFLDLLDTDFFKIIIFIINKSIYYKD